MTTLLFVLAITGLVGVDALRSRLSSKPQHRALPETTFVVDMTRR